MKLDIPYVLFATNFWFFLFFPFYIKFSVLSTLFFIFSIIFKINKIYRNSSYWKERILYYKILSKIRYQTKHHHIKSYCWTELLVLDKTKNAKIFKCLWGYHSKKNTISNLEYFKEKLIFYHVFFHFFCLIHYFRLIICFQTLLKDFSYNFWKNVISQTHINFF